MNIFETVYEINQSRPAARAMSMTMDNGERRAYTYGEVFAQVDKYADSLTAAGVTAGDRVAFVSESCPEWTIAFLAACKLHCTAALIDASMAAAELEEFILRSDVRAAFFSPKTAANFKKSRPFCFPYSIFWTRPRLRGIARRFRRTCPKRPIKTKASPALFSLRAPRAKRRGLCIATKALLKPHK